MLVRESFIAPHASVRDEQASPILLPMNLTNEQVMGALRLVKDPELGKDLVTLNMVKKVDVAGDRVKLNIELTTPACPLKDQIKTDVEREVKKLGAGSVDIDFSA